MRWSHLALAAALTSLVTPPLAATSFVRVADEALVDQSPLAVVVRVAARRTERAFATEYLAEIEQRLKGQIAQRQVAIVVPGGPGPGGLALAIHGAPRFEPGDRALVFLEPSGDGSWRLVHFLLGAFHAVEAGDRVLAVRRLAGASEVTHGASGGLVAVDPRRAEPVRDFAAFAAWVKDRARGVDRAADYAVADLKFTLFRDPQDDANLRWFEFDTGGHVTFRAHQTGQVGIAGGGYAEFQAGLAAWSAEPGTVIDYRYGGTTGATAGIVFADGVNAILFNDPGDVVPAFSCDAGGVLALGGPFYFTATTPHQGFQFHRIAEADIVINAGLACFFAESGAPQRAAEELFAHELGHTLGLAHACGDAASPACAGQPLLDGALMRAFIHDDGRGAALGEDDRAAIAALYAGSAAVPAAPSNLLATPVSASEIRLDWTDNASGETEYRVERRAVGLPFTELATLGGDTTTFISTGLAPATGYQFRVRAAGDGGVSDYSNLASAATLATPGPCVADAATLCLGGGRFRVRVAWATASAQGQGGVVAAPSATTSGLLWFFSPDNWEITVKVLDGCGVNGRFWVFASAMTDVEYALTVSDTTTGATRAYFNPLGATAQTVADTGAFPTCP